MKRFLIATAALLSVSACSTAYGPSYSPASGPSDYGYHDRRIDDNRYWVQYRLDEGDRGLAEEWAFRRAAELTLQNRYDWFQVINRSSRMTDETFRRFDAYRIGEEDRTYDRDWSPPPYREYGDREYGDGATVALEIVMGSFPPPRSSSAYDARRVLEDTRRGSRY